MQFIFTDEVKKEMKKNRKFTNDLVNSIKKYCRLDFNNLNEEGKEKNEKALKYDNKFFAYYKFSYGEIYISTIADRSLTTINFKKIN